MSRQQRFLSTLADGGFHSAQELGAKMELSAAALSRLAHSLQAAGVPLFSHPEQGYRLDAPANLLSHEKIRMHLDSNVSGLLKKLEIHASVPSTNRHLLKLAPASGHVCLAELQTAGRGRRGRSWVSPFATQICCSVAWQLEDPAALSLVTGIALAEAVRALGIADAGLKWPNDLLWNDAKLAGILIETASLPGERHLAIIGFGLNVNLPADAGHTIDQPWTDLTRASGNQPERNRVAATLLNHLLPSVEKFSTEGFAPFRPAWKRHDILRDCPVRLETPRGTEHGIATGVDRQGALRLRTSAGIRNFVSGEVSLRMAHAPAC